MPNSQKPNFKEIKKLRKEREAQLSPEARRQGLALRNKILTFLFLVLVVLAFVAWRYSIATRSEVANGAEPFWAWGGFLGMIFLLCLPIALTIAIVLRASFWAVRKIFSARLNPLYIVGVMAFIVPVGVILANRQAELGQYRIWYLVGTVLIALIAATFSVAQFSRSLKEDADPAGSVLASSGTTIVVAGVLLTAWNLLIPLFLSDLFGF